MTGAFLASSGGRISAADISAAAHKVGVRRGATVILHSRLHTLGRLLPGVTRESLTGEIIGAFIEAVGPNGTLVFPAFSFSFCRTGRFDIERTPSEMGMLSEAARRWPGARRTSHPIYSMAIIGPGHSRIERASSFTCFGPDSPFAALSAMAKEGDSQVFLATLGIDLPPSALTFIHHLEEAAAVPYRYHKVFTGTVTDTIGERKVDVDFFVRAMDSPVEFDDKACWALWQENHVGAVARVGDSMLFAATVDEVSRVTSEAIRRRPDFLCRGGYAKGNKERRAQQLNI